MAVHSFTQELISKACRCWTYRRRCHPHPSRPWVQQLAHKKIYLLRFWMHLFFSFPSVFPHPEQLASQETIFLKLTFCFSSALLSSSWGPFNKITLLDLHSLCFVLQSNLQGSRFLKFRRFSVVLLWSFKRLTQL